MSALSARYRTAREFLAAVAASYGPNGYREMSPGRWRAACLACRSKGLRDEADRRPLCVIEEGDGWSVIPVCRCSEADILAALDGSARVSGRVRVTPLDRVRARAVRWLWARLVPLGKVTVVAGAPGLGKSLLLVWLAARVSRGEAPGSLAGEPAAVLLASAEDDPEDTIKPRALAAGADLSRVSLIDLREEGPDGRPVPGLIQLPRDAPEIETAVRESGARLVVLDPVVAFLDADHSAYREQEVRAALAPLKRLAEETGCAVVVVMHLNKAEGSEPLRRIANSGAFTALARSVLVLGTDPESEDDDGRVLTVAKGNVGGGAGLALRVLARTVTGDRGEQIPTAAMEHVGESRISAEDLLGSSDDHSALGGAAAWLRDLLADGPVPVAEIKTAAKVEEHGWRTVERAKKAAGVETEKLGGPGEPWVWYLPGDDPGEGTPPTLPRSGGVGGLSSTKGLGGGGFGGLREGRQAEEVRPPRPPRPPTPPARARASAALAEHADEGSCRCRAPARSPRANGADHCRTCKRSIGDPPDLAILDGGAT